ncbi:hypothetical protein KHF85_14975 [Xanthomonas translucens pv. graminis]|uniref:hypothetical protein n=1 Tax=Xanthomonas graminis TaxID=3390026 RepID=UPI002541AC1E|nr:hypothetical protein [Xanthomonas translucens]WIH04105.1 hypothetical protein KHF85_14975 [Xanthomonas translucens pv. graminis]
MRTAARSVELSELPKPDPAAVVRPQPPTPGAARATLPPHILLRYATLRTRFKFTLLTRELAPPLLDRYSERLAGSDAPGDGGGRRTACKRCVSVKKASLKCAPVTIN